MDDFVTANALLGKLGYTPQGLPGEPSAQFHPGRRRAGDRLLVARPAYLEIEAGSRAEVVHIAALLGYGGNELTGENTTRVYARCDIDLATITDPRFEES